MNKKRRRTNIMPEHLKIKKQFTKCGWFGQITVSRNMHGTYYKTVYEDTMITHSEISEFEAEELIGNGYAFYDALKDTECIFR